MTNKKSPIFGIGLTIGAVVAGLVAFFYRKPLAKKIKELEELLKEKEIDKKVKEIFGEVTEEAKHIYLKVKKNLIKKLADLEEKWEEIDKEKYLKLVNEIVADFRREFRHTEKVAEKLKEQLLVDWQKITKK